MLTALAFTAVASLSVITVFILREGLPIIAREGLVHFVAGRVWAPTEGQVRHLTDDARVPLGDWRGARASVCRSGLPSPSS